jgi:hypothetical protein
MKNVLLFLSTTLTAIAATGDDYKALTQGIPELKMGGTAGSVALSGRMSFPLAISTKQEVPAGAGYFGDSEKGGRVVCFAHTAFVNDKPLAKNVAHWAGRKSTPKVLCAGASSRDWKDAGLDASTAKSPLTAEVLNGVDVVVISLHSKAMLESLEPIREFAKNGGGVVLVATPWAAGKEQVSAANSFLAEAGLAFLGGGPSEPSYPVTAEPPSANWSALNAIESLLSERKSGKSLAPSERQLCATTLDAVISAKELSPPLKTALNELNNAFGWITFRAAPGMKKAAMPVEAMLARYQARVLESLPAEKVPPHPSADDFPGKVGDGPSVTRTISFDATTGPDKLINHGYRTLINTGLYARPGSVLTVTLPDAATKSGLKVLIGIHLDENWHLKSWHRAPAITRDYELTQTVTKAAGAFGGIVSIVVPENCTLGKTQVTIHGAVEAPVFTLGKTTNADWKTRRNAPGAWGYIESPLWTGYVPRDILQTVDDAESVAKYWQRVVETSDEFLGYTKWRRRGEAMITDRDIVAGYGHAGYPVIMAYASEKADGARALVERAPRGDEWGFLHELGHTYQDSFDGNYTIATHAEVDVNLVPAIIKMLVHDRTAWDNNNHGTFDAKNRVKDMEAWLTKPETERTWDAACKGSSVAYDFHFVLAECFGWELYKTGFGRIMAELQKPGSDPDLSALDPKDRNFKRNRHFLAMSLAAGRNLLPHYLKYGLGRGEHGISESVIARVKALPEWGGNQPISALELPSAVRLKKNAAISSIIANAKAVDADKGTRFTYTITAGNERAIFEIEKRSGALKLAKTPESGTHQLTIEATDSTIPVSRKSATITVSVD